MNSKRLIISLMSLVLICCSCAVSSTHEEYEEQPEVLFAPLQFEDFTSFTDFCRKRENKTTLTIYTLPENRDKYTVDVITMREDVYVAVYYKMETHEKTGESIDKNDTDNTIVCVTYLFEDGSVALKQDIEEGFDRINYEGKEFYYRAVYDDKRIEKGMDAPIAYMVSFLQDKTYLFFNIPATRNLEEWLACVINVQKQVIQ